MAQYPDVPAASGMVPGMVSHTWFGLLAPAGVPKAIVGSTPEAFGRIERARDLHRFRTSPERIRK